MLNFTIIEGDERPTQNAFAVFATGVDTERATQFDGSRRLVNMPMQS